MADLDRDGRLDLVMNNNNNTPTIYMNHFTPQANWVELKLVGTSSNRDAIGARVQLHAGSKTLYRQVEAGSGYASQAMLPVHFGLGPASKIDTVVIQWPSGSVQTLNGALLGINQQVRIEEGVSHIAAVTSQRTPAAARTAEHQ